jgi:hypothetical protein
MIRYIYSGKEKTIINITDLEQLFQVYILADKVSLYGQCSRQVAEPDPDPHVLGLLDPDPLVRGMDPDPNPDPSIIKQI